MAMGAKGIAAGGVVHTEFAGEAVQLWPERGLFWATASTLIVADLHWGKSETFHAAGIPIPDGVLEHDLSRLTRMLGATGASRLLVLGDLIHSGEGMTVRMIEAVAAWRERHSVRIELVPGNHDRHAKLLPESWRVEVLAPEVSEGPFVFRHDPDGESGKGLLCGHVHPMVRMGEFRLACFVLGERVGLLPAFSLFTRGRTIHPEPGDRVFVVAPDRVVERPRLEPKRWVSKAR